jgi:hypothetical protein
VALVFINTSIGARSAAFLNLRDKPDELFDWFQSGERGHDPIEIEGDILVNHDIAKSGQ